MRPLHRRAGRLLVALALWSAAGGLAPARAAEGMTVEVTESAGAFEVHGRFRVAADGAVAWRVLTDYDGLGRFVPAMRSRLVERTGPRAATVDQETTVAFLGVQRTQRVVLRLDEAPQRRLTFEDVAHRDFVAYRGAWRLEPRADGTEVRYDALARPTWAPPVIGERLLANVVESLLDALRREIDRRAAGALAP